MEITFANPIYLWGLVSIPIYIVLYFVSIKYSRAMAVKFANFVALSRVADKVGETFNIPVLIVRILALICIILSISGMTLWYYGESANKDYVIAIDSSSSMSIANDFQPNRLEAVKIAATNFVDDLPLTSSVGVLSFSGTSYIEQVVTPEKSAVKNSIANMKLSAVGGTDLGNAIMTATNILIPSKKSRAILLLTDGRSNIGISDDAAILYANSYQVVVHAIGIGSEDLEDDILGVDEDSLSRIANLTSGNYFYVTSEEDLVGVYEELIKNPPYGKNPIDLVFPLLFLALILLMVDWMMDSTIYRKIP
jgi:Ca-activated chloride channel homolog